MKKPIKPLEELLDSVRDIEGFPIGKDEDILALSDPPYYTACPNPYINDFIDEYGKPYDEAADDYHRNPFVGDVSEGRSGSVYNGHSYHTKVPHKAIMKYVEHYTDEGDIVFDGFCGTGMTGIAASCLKRKAILMDLSPMAAFIASNYNSGKKSTLFFEEADNLLNEVDKECSWMFETSHEEKKQPGIINYTIWSDVLICPYCRVEHTFWEEAVNKSNWTIIENYNCPSCRAKIAKSECDRANVTVSDRIIGKEVLITKKIPVVINYSWGGNRYQKKPDAGDIDLIKKINESDIPYWYPTNSIPKGEKTTEPLRLGITHIHLFYTKRNLWILSSLWNKAKNNNALKFLISSYNLTHSTLMSRIIFKKGSTKPVLTGYQSGTLYISSLPVEKNILRNLRKMKLNLLTNIFSEIQNSKGVIVSTGSVTNTKIKENCIDYIFTDPPFGANIMYSELNYLWESWLRVFTNNNQEAVISNTQKKTLSNYHHLMLLSFNEYYRILKPERWITVEFHSTKTAVWNSIQEAMAKAGFIIAKVAILDKKQGSFNQVTAAGSAKNDLIISAYKPKKSFEKKFLELAGEGLEEEFIKMHLSHLKAEPSVERTEQMLYSKLLAYYVQRSYTIKYDAATFYKMLRKNFVEEDGYWFNSDQVENYREFKQKMKLDEIDEIRTGQLLLFVSDEKSAIVWLNAFLNEPKDFQTIHPAYTKISNIAGDNVPDIKELLDKNFILENGKYRRPQTEDEKMSVTQKRERELQREFDELLLEAKGSKKTIKECRKQAVVFGFEQCYKNNRFQDILDLGRRLNKKIVENDSEISEFIEVAELKVNGF